MDKIQSFGIGKIHSNMEMPDKSKVINTPKEIKNGKKKLILALVATGAIAAAGVAVAVKIKKNKFANASEIKKMILNKETGVYSKTLKNGDTVEIVLENGKMVHSERKGLVNFAKTYQYRDNGSLSQVSTKLYDENWADTHIVSIYNKFKNGCATLFSYNDELPYGKTKEIFNHSDKIVLKKFEDILTQEITIFNKHTRKIDKKFSMWGEEYWQNIDELKSLTPSILLKD